MACHFAGPAEPYRGVSITHAPAAFDLDWKDVRHGRCNQSARQSSASCICLMVRRSEEHTSELQSLMRISYAVFCLKKKNTNKQNTTKNETYANTSVVYNTTNDNNS